MVNPIAYLADFDGYQCLVFLHESGHFSAVLVRPTADAALKALRFEAAFEAACQAIPALAEWTEPARAQPTSEVLVGGSAAQRLPATGRYTGAGRRRGLGGDHDPDARTRIATACRQVTALLGLLELGEDPQPPWPNLFGAWWRPRDRARVADHIAIECGTVEALAGRGPRPERPADL